MRSVWRATLATFSRVAVVVVAVAVTAGSALAHGGSLATAAGNVGPVPAWLVAATAGVVIGASVLLSGFATGRAPSADARRVRVPGAPVLVAVVRLVGLVGLGGVVVVGLVGPDDPVSNAAVVVVWVGWWAGYGISTYLVGNSWPLVDPWRTVSRWLPRVGREYEWRYGAWPAAAALLALGWLEVASPLAERPRLLAVTVLAYSTVTVAGATVYGTGTWFRSVDPIARVFRYYGYVGPVGSGGAGRLSIRFPGAALRESAAVDGVDDVAFVLALLWVTVYDGLVTTPVWESVATAAVEAGVPAVLVYVLALCVGFGLVVGLYLLAVRVARRTVEGSVASATLARRFAPPLVAVAAGAHLAQFLGYFLSLTPTLFAALAAPVATVSPAALVLPEWIGFVAVVAVLGGHLCALRAAHLIALDLFPTRSPSRRGLYPFVAVLVCYTLVSLWVVTRPDVVPPFL